MYGHILVGTDGSDTADIAVDRAVSLASSIGARLTIMSAGKPERTKQITEVAATRHRDTGVEIDTREVADDAASALIAAGADDDVDLVVVGNKGMTGLTRFFRLGSVPNKVSHQLPCSLLIVRTT